VCGLIFVSRAAHGALACSLYPRLESGGPASKLRRPATTGTRPTDLPMRKLNGRLSAATLCVAARPGMLGYKQALDGRAWAGGVGALGFQLFSWSVSARYFESRAAHGALACSLYPRLESGGSARSIWLPAPTGTRPSALPVFPGAGASARRPGAGVLRFKARSGITRRSTGDRGRWGFSCFQGWCLVAILKAVPPTAR
jgi:hypothetical protein